MADVISEYSSGNKGEEIGVSNYRHSSGYVYDEYQKDLVGQRGRRKYREMRDSDPTIGAMIFAITSIIRTADWSCNKAAEDTTGEYADWLLDTLTTMPAMTWDDVVCDALNMVVYGFNDQEKVIYKKKDGSIGLYKLAPRSPETVFRFEIDDKGEMLGIWQRSPNLSGDIFIPASKLVHYKMDYNKGNPEGRSLLRSAYKPYHFINTITIQEAIGAERDLTGMPIIYAPSAFLNDSANRASMERIARDIKFNDQGGLVMPSDTFIDSDGNKTSVKQFEIKLASVEGGASRVDTDKIIQRHKRDMASTILAQFIMLGEGKGGSYSLSENQTDMFLKAIESILEIICQTIDRQVTPWLWELNGFPDETKPCLTAGNIAPEDLQKFGDFLAKISAAGIPINDLPTEDFIRAKAGLPPAPDDESLYRTPPDSGNEEDPAEDPKDKKPVEKWIDKHILNRGKKR